MRYKERSVLVGYAGVFRISEILNLRAKDITILDGFVKINLIKRKNDQYREGHVSRLAISRKPTCPVGITERLLPDSKVSCYPLIRRIFKSKSSQSFHKS